MLLRRHRKLRKANKEPEQEINKDLTVKELKDIAKKKELEGYSDLKKDELIELLEGE